MAVVNGLRANRLDALWNFLPASYQRDLNQLLHEFAKRMDPEIWDRGVVAVRKFARVLKDKQAFQPLPRPDAGQPPTDWGQLADVLETLLASDLADLDKLKHADVGKLLAETGGQILSQAQAFSKLGPRDFFGQNLEQLANLHVTPLESSGDKATVQFEPRGQEPQTIEFVRVEGKWIPRNLSDGWIEMMGEARARLLPLSPENLAAMKPTILDLILRADQALDDLLAANTREEFNAAGARADEVLRAISALAGPPESELGSTSPEEGPELSGPVGTVTVIIKGQLDDDAQNELRDRLQGLADEGGSPFADLTADDESTTIQLGPVADLAGFAKKLDFLQITGVDEKTRTITAERR